MSKSLHAARLTTDRLAAPKSDTAKIFDALDALLPEGAHINDDSLKAQQFHELIRRSIEDVSGHLNLADQSDPKAEPSKARITIGRNFDIVKGALNEMGVNSGDGADKVSQFFMDMVGTYTKGIVQTPHPTEVLGKEAIHAEEKLVQALEHEGKELFTKSGTTLEDLPPAALNKLSEGFKTLFDAMDPLDKALTVSDEMSRSIRFSERMFDSVPIVVNRVLAPTQQKTSDLSIDELKAFSNILKPMTWSPGDQDNKPLMKVSELEQGYRMNRRAMFKHYALKLVELLDDAPDLNKGAQNKVIEVTRNLLKSAEKVEDQDKSEGNEAFDDYAKAALEGVAEKRHIIIGDQKGPDHLKQSTIDMVAEHDSQPKEYADAEQIISDLDELRKLGGGLNHLLDLNGDKAKQVGAIDALIIQAQNFGLTALQSQIRQNSAQHEEVFKKLVSLLPEDLKSQIHSAKDLAQAMRYEDNAATIRGVIEKELDHIAELPSHADRGKNAEEFYFYQTLKTMEFATHHSDFIPQYLIAECGMREKDDSVKHADSDTLVKIGADDMMTALALLKAMEPSAEERAAKHLPPVEIVPLVEHPQQVLEDDNGKIPFVEMMKKVLGDKDYQVFRDHHEAVSNEQYQHLLKNPTMENGEIVKKPLTGTDIIAQVNSEFGKKEAGYIPKANDKPVAMAKLIMGAGSDVTKFGGVGASALMQNVMVKLKEGLASLDNPVLVMDYIGCGGGIHRMQPVSNNMETVQGRSMRKTPDAVATKITALLARHMRDRLASDPQYAQDSHYLDNSSAARVITDPERRTLAQLNLGNMANLPQSSTYWNEVSKPLMQKAAKDYIEFTSQPEYQAMLSHAANAFSKLTSYAARPATRLHSGSDAPTFPPPIEIGGIRAIGYGATLNASGSSAGLYLGMGALAEAAEKDMKGLVNAYLHDPLLQESVNRATYGVVMADMDTAWKYVGENKMPDEAALKELDAKLGHNDDGMSDLEQAKVALAHVTLEYQKVGKALVDLHSRVSGRHALSDKKYSLAESLLSVLPSALASQVKSSRENIAQPREALAALFQKTMQNNGHEGFAVDSFANRHLNRDTLQTINNFEGAEINRKDENGKLTEVYNNIVYPSMGAILECYEHAPRAFTSPHWALAQSQQQQQSR